MARKKQTAPTKQTVISGKVTKPAAKPAAKKVTKAAAKAAAAAAATASGSASSTTGKGKGAATPAKGKGKGKAAGTGKAPPGVDDDIIEKERKIEGTKHFYSRSGKYAEYYADNGKYLANSTLIKAVVSQHQAGISAHGTTYTIISEKPTIKMCKVVLKHNMDVKEEDEDEEDADCVIYHSMVDYDHLFDYPRGWSLNYTGRRKGGKKGYYPAITPEAARLRLRLIDEELLDEKTFAATRAKVEARVGKTLAKTQARVAAGKKRVSTTGPLYKAFKMEVKSALEKHGFTAVRGKSDNPEAWHEMLVDIVMWSRRLHFRHRAVMMLGSVRWDGHHDTPDYMPDWSPDSTEFRDHIQQQAPPYEVRSLLDTLWFQEKRFLWHALDTLVVSMRTSFVNGWMLEEIVNDASELEWAYFREKEHDETQLSPFCDDTAVCANVTDNRYAGGSTDDGDDE